MSTLRVTVDLDRSGVDSDGLTRDEAISILRTALFFTPISYHIEVTDDTMCHSGEDES